MYPNNKAFDDFLFLAQAFMDLIDRCDYSSKRKGFYILRCTDASRASHHEKDTFKKFFILPLAQMVVDK